jgi:hypothetical protein
MSLTALIVTGAIIFLGIYDLVVVTFNLGIGSSISRFMQRTALRHPAVSFSVGFVCGHIFGYMAPEPEKIKTTDHVYIHGSGSFILPR